MASESSVLLDATGRKLLSALQENARLSYAELGRRIGLSPAATAERLKRLEEAGVITGYRVEIDREALGLPILAIIRMSCDGARYRPFLKAVKGFQNVVECHHVAGGEVSGARGPHYQRGVLIAGGEAVFAAGVIVQSP
jgi:Lrp/AsnC family leucine-responsive transcriptional regulator